MANIIVYGLSDGFFSGEEKEIDTLQGVPAGYVTEAPPDIPDGKRVVWLGWGSGWELQDKPATVVRVPLPPEVNSIPVETPLTQREFRSLWTFEERVKCDNPDVNEGLTPLQKAQLRTLMTDLSAAQEVILSSPDVQMGLALVTSLGIITSERAARISSGLHPE